MINAKTRLPAMLHYTGGKLTGVKLPGDTVQPCFVDSISRIPGTAEQLAGGFVYAVDGSGKNYAIFLQYS